jgi:hypothetical protein
MHISFHPFKRASSGWKDGLEWLEDAAQWCSDYEDKNMVPHKDNAQTANETTSILLAMVPSSFKSAGVKIVTCLMDERLRAAMMYPTPSTAYQKTVAAVLNLRRLFLVHLALPRPGFMGVQTASPYSDPTTGNYFLLRWQKDPFYVQPNFWNRWGSDPWISRLFGAAVPQTGKEGEKYSNGGYHIENVGPDRLKSKGREEIEKERENLRTSRTGGCPMAFGR